jgi:TolB-like protein
VNATSAYKVRLAALDRCLQRLEDALAGGQLRVDARLGTELRELLAHAGLIPDHRLEGRRIDRVLDDIFALQGQLLGADEQAQAAGR